MTTKAEWLALSERCEKATGPDREIDARITLAHRPYLFAKPYIQLDIGEWIRTDGCPDVVTAPDYTASLDAIAALIERELTGWDWSTAKSHGHCRANVWRLSPISRGSFPPKHATAATAALALCAAFCRVMAEKAA